jgi:hypothetical protein
LGERRELLCRGFRTHGKPSGIPLTELGTQQGTVSQQVIYHIGPFAIPAVNIKPPIKGSEAFLNDPTIKATLDKLHGKRAK